LLKAGDENGAKLNLLESKRAKTRVLIVCFPALVLALIFGLLLPTVRIDGQTANDLNVVFGTIFTYNTSGDVFANAEVSGNQVWFSNFTNSQDYSGEPATNVTLTLVTDKTFDRISAPPGLIDRGPVLNLTGPPMYRWSAGNVPEFDSTTSGPQVPQNVSQTSSQATFTPGFDLTRTIDRTVFNETGVQTMIVTVTPRKDLSYFEVIIKPISNDHVKTQITFPVTDASQGVFVSPDNSSVSIYSNQKTEAGEAKTFTTKILVTPIDQTVEIIPPVRVATSEEQATGNDSESSCSLAVSDLGTWTWSADGIYEWFWSENIMKAVVLNGNVRGVNLAPVSLPEPDNQTTADALQTPDQKSLVQTGFAAILALIITAVFLLMSAFFNSALKSNYMRIQNWLKRILNKVKLGKVLPEMDGNEERRHKFQKRDYIEFGALLIINALINAFVKQPDNFSVFVNAFIPSIIIVTVLTICYAGAQVLLSNHYDVPSAIRMYYVAVLVAIIFVIFTRILKYPPLLIYGFVGGYFVLSLKKEMNPDQKTKAILLSVGVVLIISIAAFYLRGPIHNDIATSGNILDNTLAKLCCGGLLGLFLYLLPFSFMDGAKLKARNFWIYLSVFFIVAAAFCYFVIIEDDNLIQVLLAEKSLGIYIFMLACILIGFGNWLFFRLRYPANTNKDLDKFRGL
jgi:hypothetical protein